VTHSWHIHSYVHEWVTACDVAWLTRDIFIRMCTNESRHVMWRDSLVTYSFVCVRMSHGMWCCVTHSWTVARPFVNWVVESVVWLIRTCDMTHSYVGHDSCSRCAWRSVFSKVGHVRRASCVCVTWLVRMCDMTRALGVHEEELYSCPDGDTKNLALEGFQKMCSRRCGMCGMTHWCVWHDSVVSMRAVCVTWLQLSLQWHQKLCARRCGVTHSYIYILTHA